MTERYEIIEASVGEGGYGRVDRAHDTTLDRPVAIKTLDPLFRVELREEDIERFSREAKTLAQLSHPNIPAIYDVQFSPPEGEFRIIFEWIAGTTLRSHLQDRGVLSLEQARRAFSNICSALGHAHARQVVHRDLKPANIIMSAEVDSCYVVDFGIALQKGDLTRLTGTTGVGTSGYMSPEQERGDEVTQASDVFSLGVVLYECLAGIKPAVGGYRALGLHNEAIPPGIDSLIQSALDEDPAKRPQTARLFFEQFSTTLQPHASFTSTLADGSLHEIQIALSAMTARDFAGLPPGQRVLLMTRMADLAAVDEEAMRRAAAALLRELVRLAHTGDKDQYRKLIGHAVSYGYDKQFGESWIGDGPTRAAVNVVALECSDQPHEVLQEAATSMATADDVANQQGWYFHDLRVLLQNLLTNPACDEPRAQSLGAALTNINLISH